MPSPMLRLIAAVVLALAAIGARAPAPAAQRGTRIVAIGDLHGSLDSLTTILQTAGLIDAQRRWTGGRARLVQTGDFLDRGADVRGVMDLLMKLEEDARRAGGRVDVLFGNHEGMNVLRDLRDVSEKALASFADRDSDSKRSRAFSTHAALASRTGVELNRNDWLREHPPGYVEYIQAMGPSGRYGRWLRSRKVVLKIEDSIFMHAGIPVDSKLDPEEINRTVEREVRTFDGAVEALTRAGRIGPASTLQEVVNAAVAALNEVAALLRDKKEVPPEVTQEYVTTLQGLLQINQWTLTTPEGPLWYRGYATLGDEAAPQIDALARRLGVARLTVGHTPQLPGQIRSRFGGRVFLIDTGMLTSYFKGGRPSALELAEGRATALYPGERTPLAP